MKRVDPNLLWGGLLILAGVIFLVQSLGLVSFGLFWGVFWSLAFLGAGVVCLGAFWRNEELWWALIAGFSLLGLGALAGLSLVGGDLVDKLGPSLFLGAIGFGFCAVYLTRHEHWWAIIPGGILLSIAAMVGAEAYLGGGSSVGLMFLGFALTFAVVGILPNTEERMTWAFIPAAIFLFLAMFMAGGSALLTYLVPLALIVVGGILLYRNARQPE
jgi:hypothetical protein